MVTQFPTFPDAICKIYPEHQWLMWKFATVPKNFWGHMDNQRQFALHLAKNVFNFQDGDMESWYNITAAQINEFDGAFAPQCQTSLSNNGEQVERL